MRTVIQRVKTGAVDVDGERLCEIGAGMLLLLGVEGGDTEADLEWLAAKVAGLRIFNDDNGVMNRPVTDLPGLGIIVVSQFTLTASTRKGNRPSYIRAERPEAAEKMYERFCLRLEELTGRSVGRGRFGADMTVSLVNDGPVTIIIDSRLRE